MFAAYQADVPIGLFIVDEYAERDLRAERAVRAVAVQQVPLVGFQRFERLLFGEGVLGQRAGKLQVIFGLRARDHDGKPIGRAGIDGDGGGEFVPHGVEGERHFVGRFPQLQGRAVFGVFNGLFGRQLEDQPIRHAADRTVRLIGRLAIAELGLYDIGVRFRLPHALDEFGNAL